MTADRQRDTTTKSQPTRGGLLGQGLVALLATIFGCHASGEPRAKAENLPQNTATARPPTVAVSSVAPPAPPPPPPAIEKPATVDRMLVPGDQPAAVIRGKDASPPLTVFMPGVCSNGSAYLHTFPEAAKRHGGVIAIEGDQPCGGLAGYRTFSWDAARQHARVEAALAAAGVVEIPPEGITLVGYSQGAALAEQMVERWPDRYSRVVLIGAPTDPAPRSLARARGVVTMSCDRDVPARMKQAASRAAKAGTPALYLEMPGCSHGNVTEGERLFTEAFDFLRTSERPLAPLPERRGVKIVGSPST